MPIIKHEKVTASISLCIWHIEEDEETLRKQIQCIDSSNELQTISNAIKRLEWLSSRLALKHLIDFHGCEFSKIYKDDHGKPFFSKNHHISLAHSHPYAAAIFNHHLPTGIDIEMVQPKLLKVAGKYLNEMEIADVAANEAKACVYWTCKEALFKMYGRRKISFKEHLFIQKFRLNADGGAVIATVKTEENITQHKLRYIKIGNYYLSYCLL